MSDEEREAPPIFGRWRWVYAVEVGALVVAVALLRWLTVASW
jgi:hypothetical protein